MHVVRREELRLDDVGALRKPWLLGFPPMDTIWVQWETPFDMTSVSILEVMLLLAITVICGGSIFVLQCWYTLS